MKKFAVLFAAVGGVFALFIAGHVFAQNELVRANECVRDEWVKDGYGDREHWKPRHRVTNNCDYPVFVRWVRNHGETGRKCIYEEITLRPGWSDLTSWRLPWGVSARIKTCSSYDSPDVQGRTGQKSCTESDSPMKWGWCE